MHAAWAALLTELNEASRVSASLLGRVLGRVMVGGGMIGGPGVPRAEIIRGSMLAVPRELSPGTVSKATAALVDKGLLTAPSSRSGGPMLPLSLGRDRWVIGIHVEDRHRQLRMLTGVLTRLDGEEIAVVGADECQIVEHASGRDEAALIPAADKLVGLLRDKAERERGIHVVDQDIHGVGVEIGGHVLTNGDVLLGTEDMPENRLHLGLELAALLQLPVVVENDVNARAIHALFKGRFAKTLHPALVQVFDEGVGGALMSDTWIYRGGGGMAMEPGHLSVEYPTSPPSSDPPPASDPEAPLGFAAPCLCNPKKYGHVDTLATPARIRAELGVDSLEEAANAPALVPYAEDPDSLCLSREGVVFRRAGTALGRGLAHIINIVNPSQLLLRLPTALAAPAPQTSGAQYLAAVENAVNEAFSTGPQDARMGKQHLPVEAVDPDVIPHEGALAAAAVVLHRFVEHANNRDDCFPRRH